MSTYREHVQACIHPDTYKYFLPADRVVEVWETLASRYGGVRRNDCVGTIEVESRGILVRSTALGNPLTLFRKRHCSPQDVDEFHSIVSFDGAAP